MSRGSVRWFRAVRHALMVDCRVGSLFPSRARPIPADPTRAEPELRPSPVSRTVRRDEGVEVLAAPVPPDASNPDAYDAITSDKAFAAHWSYAAA